jgi:hypothetical protein
LHASHTVETWVSYLDLHSEGGAKRFEHAVAAAKIGMMPALLGEIRQVCRPALPARDQNLVRNF